jgi:O-antigen ligase
MSSFSRAGISSTLVVCCLMCIALRRYRLLIKGTAVILVLAFCAISIVPHSSYMPDVTSSQSLGDAYLYKGKMDAGVFGSRRSVWQETWSSIKENPWFGTGFGTSKIEEDMSAAQYAANHIDSWIIREHGNSYLAIAEWTGLLGVVPFYALIALTIAYACKVFVWLRKTGNVFSPAIPAAAIILAGLFHAMFEDWMFAVGYYLCVFFWVTAFIMVDVLPWRMIVLEPATILMPTPNDYLPAASGQ